MEKTKTRQKVEFMSWQGWQSGNQTFDDDVECDPDEIRALFEDEEQKS